MATPFPGIIDKIKSERNKDKASTQGFLYTLNRSVNGREYWVCEKRGICKARLQTMNDNIIKPANPSDIQSQHSHGPDIARVEMLKGYNDLKIAARNSEVSTRNLLSISVVNFTPESINKLPKLDSVKRTIRNYKSIHEENVGNPSSCADIIIPNMCKSTLRGESFLLSDSGVGDTNRLILFATANFLSILKESPNWYCDGTFKVCPEQFFQIYTIHAEKDGNVFPCVYGLLRSKNELTYDRMFNKLVELEPELNPSSIMVDFEKAAINSLEKNFIACVSGCIFHLSQSIYRRIQASGLTTDYQQDRDFALKLKMLPCLAFVPEIDVIDCFNILIEEYPHSALSVAKYFEDAYIGKRLPDHSRRLPPYPIRMWNMHTRVIKRMARTNNSVEGWHNAFNSGIGHPHPTFVKLVKYIQREQSLQEAKYAKWEGGSNKATSKMTIERDKRIYNIVVDYKNRDTLEYLRGIAYNINY